MISFKCYVCFFSIKQRLNESLKILARITWFNVNRYEGGWEYGLFDGQGTYYSYPSGVKVIGEFRRDKEWNTLRYDKDGNIIEKIVRGKLKKD